PHSELHTIRYRGRYCFPLPQWRPCFPPPCPRPALPSWPGLSDKEKERAVAFSRHGPLLCPPVPQMSACAPQTCSKNIGPAVGPQDNSSPCQACTRKYHARRYVDEWSPETVRAPGDFGGELLFDILSTQHLFIIVIRRVPAPHRRSCPFAQK